MDGVTPGTVDFLGQTVPLIGGLIEDFAAFFEYAGAVEGAVITTGSITIGGRIVGATECVGVGQGVPIRTVGMFEGAFEGAGVGLDFLD